MTKWLWALRHPDDTKFWFWPHFESEESVAANFPQAERIKLEWSKTDFPS